MHYNDHTRESKVRVITNQLNVSHEEISSSSLLHHPDILTQPEIVYQKILSESRGHI